MSHAIISCDQQAGSIIDIWHYIENEQVIEENKETTHASFTSFISEKSALNNYKL